MVRLWIICVLCLSVVGCANFREHLWVQIHSAVTKEVDDQFDDADADKNKELSKPEVQDLVNRALKPVKKIVVGDDDG